MSAALADAMKIIIAFAALSLAATLAHADVQRCIGMRPDAKRLACFDAEVKRPARLVDERPAPRARSDGTSHAGPAASGA